MPPADLLEGIPEKPILNVMFWMRGHAGQVGRSKGIKFPLFLLDKWYQRSSCGQEFRDLVDEVTSICGTEEHSEK